MQFLVDTNDLEVRVVDTIVAGWTGRDKAAVDHHIEELAELGVAPPSSVPLFYRVSSLLLTQDEEIEVLGPDTSGEVEPLIIATKQGLYLGLASDHTDRSLETASVAASKQACPKPVALELWRLEDVEDHLDQLKIRSWIWEDENWVLYQDGSLLGIRPLGELMEKFGLGTENIADGEAIIMLCGTCVVVSGCIRAARRFKMSISDPVTGREIVHEYKSKELPIVA